MFSLSYQEKGWFTQYSYFVRTNRQMKCRVLMNSKKLFIYRMMYVILVTTICLELASQLKSAPIEMVLPLEVALTAMVFAVSVSIKFRGFVILDLVDFMKIINLCWRVLEPISFKKSYRKINILSTLAAFNTYILKKIQLG